MNMIRHGFTIIESVLVLAITGLVISVVLVGIGTSLRAERYRDATNQTIDYFQGQYNAVANMANDRPTTDTCGSTGVVEDAGGTGRGRSDCLLLGYVIRSDDGQQMTVKKVIGTKDVSKIAGEDQKSEVQTIKDSSLVESSTSDQYSLEWGTRLIQSGKGVRFSLLIVRAPLSGVIKTFLHTTSSTANLNALLNSPLPSGGVSYCIDPSGIFDIGVQPTGFVIDQNASNSSGIRQITAGAC